MTPNKPGTACATSTNSPTSDPFAMSAAPTLTEQALSAPLDQHTPMMAQYVGVKQRVAQLS